MHHLGKAFLATAGRGRLSQKIITALTAIIFFYDRGDCRGLPEDATEYGGKGQDGLGYSGSVSGKGHVGQPSMKLRSP